MKNKRMVGIFAVVLGVLIALIPKLIFPVCTGTIELINGKSLYMKCHWTARVEILVDTLIVFNGILILLFKNYQTRISISIMLFLLGLTALLIPTLVIGMCEAAAMDCRVGTEPALIVISVITMIASSGSIISQLSLLKADKLHKERSVIK